MNKLQNSLASIILSPDKFCYTVIPYGKSILLIYNFSVCLVRRCKPVFYTHWNDKIVMWLIFSLLSEGFQECMYNNCMQDTVVFNGRYAILEILC